MVKLGKQWTEMEDRPLNVNQLRYEARCQWLDGKNARSSALTKLADAMDRRLSRKCKT